MFGMDALTDSLHFGSHSGCFGNSLVVPAHHALLAFEPWLRRATAQANIADEISRMGLSRAERER